MAGGIELPSARDGSFSWLGSVTKENLYEA